MACGDDTTRPLCQGDKLRKKENEFLNEKSVFFS
jgi:hypothetical protein